MKSVVSFMELDIYSAEVSIPLITNCLKTKATGWVLVWIGRLIGPGHLLKK